MKIKWKSPGRGGQFSFARGISETVMGVLFARRWPARLLDRVPAATRVQLIEHELRLSNGAAAPLDSAAAEPASLRLAFISDLHIGPLTPRRLLDNAFQMLARLAPDVLVLGGDYVFLDVNDDMARELEERVAAVPARTKLAVMGNHDLWTHNHVIERALERAGCRVLVNDAHRLPPPMLRGESKRHAPAHPHKKHAQEQQRKEDGHRSRHKLDSIHSNPLPRQPALRGSTAKFRLPTPDF